MEAVHYSLDGHEKNRGLKVKRNIGSDEHLKRALKSHISFNSLRVGSHTETQGELIIVKNLVCRSIFLCR